MTGEHLAAQAQRPQQRPRQRRPPPTQRRSLLHDQLDHCQDERQPRRPGNDHRVHDRDDQKAAELEGDPADQPPQAADAQHAGEEIGKHPRQPQLQPGEHAVGSPQWEDVENDAEGIKRRVLPVGQKGMTGKNVRIPERQFLVLKRFDDELLPDIVLQDQIVEQGILRNADAQFVRGSTVRLKDKEVVGRQQRLGAQDDRGEQQEGQQEQQGEDAQIGQCFADHVVNRSPGRRWRWRRRTSHVRSAASILTGVVILE